MSQENPNLYELTEAIRAESERIAEMMERTQGDEALMTQEDREANGAFLEGLRTEAGLKADGYAKAIRQVDARAEMRREEARRIADMAAADERRADSIRRFLVQCMGRAGMTKLEGAVFTIAVQQNGGKQPVEVIEGVELPDRFVKVTKSADREALRAALLAGDTEASQYAALGQRGVSLRIR